MTKHPIRLAFCLTGSFCTFEKAFAQMEKLVSLGYEVLPVFPTTRRLSTPGSGRRTAI